MIKAMNLALGRGGGCGCAGLKGGVHFHSSVRIHPRLSAPAAHDSHLIPHSCVCFDFKRIRLTPHPAEVKATRATSSLPEETPPPLAGELNLLPAVTQILVFLSFILTEGTL